MAEAAPLLVGCIDDATVDAESSCELHRVADQERAVQFIDEDCGSFAGGLGLSLLVVDIHAPGNVVLNDRAVDVGNHPVAFARSKYSGDALQFHAGAGCELAGHNVLEQRAEVGCLGLLILWIVRCGFVVVHIERRAVAIEPEDGGDVAAADACASGLEPLKSVSCQVIFR